jgi:hypothetical protein
MSGWLLESTSSKAVNASPKISKWKLGRFFDELSHSGLAQNPNSCARASSRPSIPSQEIGTLS